MISLGCAAIEEWGTVLDPPKLSDKVVIARTKVHPAIR